MFHECDSELCLQRNAWTFRLDVTNIIIQSLSMHAAMSNAMDLGSTNIYIVIISLQTSPVPCMLYILKYKML